MTFTSSSHRAVRDLNRYTDPPRALSFGHVQFPCLSLGGFGFLTALEFVLPFVLFDETGCSRVSVESSVVLART